MRHCPGCGHHHGTNDGWVRCQAITYEDTGGARRCGCTGAAMSS
ncbi:hypothetical protein SRABI83_03240 [Arthrobacter sp. Bi83]|nr:hypothetical protein SRABI83_03240 [Arthrobacter sp. Bi83]